MKKKKMMSIEQKTQKMSLSSRTTTSDNNNEQQQQQQGQGQVLKKLIIIGVLGIILFIVGYQSITQIVVDYWTSAVRPLPSLAAPRRRFLSVLICWSSCSPQYWTAMQLPCLVHTSCDSWLGN